jgi:hypothetical protein
MDKIDKLLKRLEQGLVSKLIIPHNEINKFLDERDEPFFTEAWMKAFRQIEVIKGGKHDADPRVSRLRELAYLQAYEQWQSPELAAYISDDFGLLGDALATGISVAWLNGLLDAYLNSKFPHGNLPELGEDL